MRDFYSMNLGDALAQNRRYSISMQLHNLEFQSMVVQFNGWLSAMVEILSLCAAQPKRVGPRLKTTARWGINRTRLQIIFVY